MCYKVSEYVDETDRDATIAVAVARAIVVAATAAAVIAVAGEESA